MNRVNELIIGSGMSQKQVALEIGVSRPTVSDWANNKKDPSGVNLHKLAHLFNVDWHEIIVEPEEWAQYPPGVALRHSSPGLRSVPRPAPKGLTDEDLQRIADFVRSKHPDLDEGAPKTRQARILAAGIDKLPEADRDRALAFYQLLFADHAEFFNEKGKADDET